MSDLNQAQTQNLSVVDDAPPTQPQGLPEAPTLQDVQQAALFLPDQAIRELYSYFGVESADDLAETDWREFIRLANMASEDRAGVVGSKRAAPPIAVETLPITMRDKAVALAKLGFRVLPVKPGTKAPAQPPNKPRPPKGRYHQHIPSRDPADVAAMWTGPNGESLDFDLGINTEGLLVLDIDDRDNRTGSKSFIDLVHEHGLDTDTVITQTPSGGRHYFYRLPADIDPTTVKFGSDKLGSGIDHRSYNSLVVGAGTVRPGKGEYTWVRSLAEYEMKEAPRSLVEPCRREKTRQEHEPLVMPGVEIDSPEVMERFRQYAKNYAPEAVQNAGGRNATIALLRWAGDYGLSYFVATEILCEEGGWNETKAIPSWDENELLELAESLEPSRERPIGCEHPAAQFDAVELGEGASEGLRPCCTLDDLHNVFRKWLGDEYDMDAIDAVAATAAAERLDGDPLWLLIVSGPGAAKTETVQALFGCGAHITSTIQSEGALLSATSARARTKKATGGLLRKIGERGILVIKDVTSILSADRQVRGGVLAAIREIYDGRWERNVGTDGGQTLTWTGRIAVIGAVTTAWDTAHAVISAMGDRFVLLRIDSNEGRKPSGQRAIRNTGDETQMREQLAAAVAGVVQHAAITVDDLTQAEEDRILNAADIVTLARTAVERDYAGEIINSHAPEMPTRFAKQLTQMLRGGVAIGMPRERALQLVIRCARDSIPPLRLEILLDLAKYPHSRPGDVRRRIDKPWRTTKREMEALHMLGLLQCREESQPDEGNKDKTVWRYTLADGFDRETLLAMAGQTTSIFDFNDAPLGATTASQAFDEAHGQPSPEM